MSELQKRYNPSQSRGEFARHYLDYLSDLLANLDTQAIEQVIVAFEQAIESDGTVYFIGNGGSAATAIHLACDMRLNTRAPGHKPFKAISLVENAGAVTALGNDAGYENIFTSQLEDILQAKDVVVALSASGNSPNVIKAIEYAKTVCATTIGWTGFDGGKLRQLVDISVHVDAPRPEYGPVEDIHMIMDHLIVAYMRLDRRGAL